MKKKFPESLGTSIASRLFIMLIFIGLIPLIVLSVVSLAESSKNIKTEIASQHKLFGGLTKDSIETYFLQREAEANLLSHSKIVTEGVVELNNYNLSASEKLNLFSEFDTFFNIGVTESNYTDVFITNNYKEVVYSLNYEPLDMAPVVVNGEYLDMAYEGKQSWSSIFRNTYINDNIIVLSTPIYSDNKIIGCINVVLNQKDIDIIVNMAVNTLSQTAISFLENEEGVLVSHVSNIDSTSYQLLSSKGQDVLPYNFIRSHFNVFVGEKKFVLTIGIDPNEAYSLVKRMKFKLIMCTILAMLISSFVAIIVGRPIKKPVIDIIKKVELLSKYDLRVNFKRNLKSNDEMKVLENTMSVLTNEFSALLKEVNDVSNVLLDSSSKVLVDSEKVYNLSLGISEAVSVITYDAKLQRDETQKGWDKLETFSLILNAQEKQKIIMSNSLNSVNKTVVGGEKVVDHLMSVHSISNELGKKVDSQIKNSVENSKSIEVAISLVNNIAEKTNLLALNASIEAARAGEHGLGFSVVASEISALADQSKETTREIALLIGHLKTEHELVMTSVNEMTIAASESLKSVADTKNHFKRISEACNVTLNEVKKLNEDTSRLTEIKEDVNDSFNVLFEKSGTIADKTQTTLDFVNLQGSGTFDITQESNSLELMAQKLKKSIGVFKYN